MAYEATNGTISDYLELCCRSLLLFYTFVVSIIQDIPV